MFISVWFLIIHLFHNKYIQKILKFGKNAFLITENSGVADELW